MNSLTGQVQKLWLQSCVSHGNLKQLSEILDSSNVGFDVENETLNDRNWDVSGINSRKSNFRQMSYIFILSN